MLAQGVGRLAVEVEVRCAVAQRSRARDQHDLDAVLLLVGVFAGTINTVVGSGSLVTFLVLLALGYPPVVANVSNNLGILLGGLSGGWGYRAHVRGTGTLRRRVHPVSLLGGAIGAVALLVLPGAIFTTVVIVLIAVALVLVVCSPRSPHACAVPAVTDAGSR